MAITDATLTLFVLAAQICLYRAYVGKGGWLTAIGMGVAVGLAGLTKGPVVIRQRNDVAPQHAARLKQLARDGFYNNAPFHRVSP